MQLQRMQLIHWFGRHLGRPIAWTMLCLCTVPPTAFAQNLQSKIEEVHRSAGASVLNITSKVLVPNMLNMVTPRKGTGSGFVYDAAGHIVTSYHIVQNATQVMVSLSKDDMYEATIVGTDPSTDLAVLKIDAENVPPPLTMGESSDVAVGQFAVAIGNSFGLRRTLTFGVISAVGRIIHSPNGRFISEVLQTDAPVNPGNSGGPLLDLDGNVIGINTMILSPSGASSGVGFAVSAETIDTVCPVLIEKGTFPHPWLGIRSVSLNKALVTFLEKAGVPMPAREGLLLVGVAQNGPAAKAGLQSGDTVLQIGMLQLPTGGDIITAIDGEPISTHKQLVLYLEKNTDIGQTVTVTFYRDQKKRTEALTVAKRPEKVTAGSVGKRIQKGAGLAP